MWLLETYLLAEIDTATWVFSFSWRTHYSSLKLRVWAEIYSTDV